MWLILAMALAVDPQVEENISLLASESYEHREKATQFLDEKGLSILPRLMTAVETSNDIEARFRMERIIHKHCPILSSHCEFGLMHHLPRKYRFRSTADGQVVDLFLAYYEKAKRVTGCTSPNGIYPNADLARLAMKMYLSDLVASGQAQDAVLINRAILAKQDHVSGLWCEWCGTFNVFEQPVEDLYAIIFR